MGSACSTSQNKIVQDPTTGQKTNVKLIGNNGYHEEKEGDGFHDIKLSADEMRGIPSSYNDLTGLDMQSNLTSSSGEKSLIENVENHQHLKKKHRVLIRKMNEEENEGKLKKIGRLTSFLPSHLLKHLKSKEENSRMLNQEANVEEEVLHEEAAILFIDISGFTQLTEELAQYDHGTEKLSSIVNRFFRKIMNTVMTHGGDIERFAGDALICTFWSISMKRTLKEATTAALACAQMIISNPNLRKFRVSKTKTLTLHIGISSGKCRIYHIGGINNTFWRLLMSEAFEELATAVSESHDGEIVITGPTYPLLSDSIKAQRIINTTHYLFQERLEKIKTPKLEPIVVKSTMEPLLRKFIENHTLEAIDTNQYISDFASGIKKVSIVFINVTLNGDGEHDYLDQWNNLLQVIQTSVSLYEGVIGNFLNDEKGVILFCAFGYPKTHMNDPYRAIRCAFEIQEHFKSNSMFNLGIGITTGKVFLGTSGTADRRDFTFLGDAVNLASRLMNLSVTKHHGQIVTDSATFDQSKNQIEFAPLAKVQVKGKESMLNVFLAQREKESTDEIEGTDVVLLPTVRKYMFNHLNEMALKFMKSSPFEPSMNAIETVKVRGFPYLVLIEGKKGSGKTHMLNSFRKSISDGKSEDMKNILIQNLLKEDLEMNKSFNYFRKWFKQIVALFEIVSNNTVPNFKSKKDMDRSLSKMYGTFSAPRKENILKKMVDREEYSSMFVFNTIFDTDFAAPKSIDTPTFHRTQVSMFTKLLVAWYKLMQKNNLFQYDKFIVCLEDYHHMDDISKDLFNELFMGPVNDFNVNAMVIMTTNKEEFSKMEELHHLENNSQHVLNLNDLGADEMSQLLLDEANENQDIVVENIDRELVNYMIKKTHGNAQIASLLIHKLLDNRLVLCDEGIMTISRVRRHEIEDVSLPTNIALLTQQRIDNLSPHPKFILRIASIIGLRFSISILTEIIPKSLSENTNVKDHLNILVKEGFLKISNELNTDGKYIYEFINKVTKDIAYNSLLLDRKESIHGQLGEKFSELYMIKRKTKSFTEVNLHDHQLCDIIVGSAKHFASSSAVNQSMPYSNLAVWTIELAVSHILDIENDIDVFHLLNAYISILTHMEEDKAKKDSMMVAACANLARNAYNLKYKFDQKDLLASALKIKIGRDTCEANGTTASPEYLTIITFKWLIHTESGLHRLNIEILNALDQRELFQRFLASTLSVISHYWVGEYELAMSFYRTASAIYSSHSEEMSKMSHSHTLLPKDLGVMMNLYGGRTAYITGKHMLAEHTLYEVISICSKNDMPHSTVLSAITGLFQAAITGNPSKYRYLLEYAESAMADPRLLKHPKYGLYSTIFQIYRLFYRVINEKLSYEDFNRKFYKMRAIIEHEDFEENNEIFRFLTLFVAINAIESGLKLTQSCITDLSKVKVSSERLITTRDYIKDVEAFSDKYANTNAEHLQGLIFTLHGSVQTYAYLVDSIAEYRLEHHIDEELLKKHCDSFLPTSSHTHFNPGSWIERGIAKARKLSAVTYEIMSLVAKVKCDIIFSKSVERAELIDDHASLKFCFENKLETEETKLNLPLMIDVQNTLADAEQILKIYELLVVFKDEKIRLNVSNIVSTIDLKKELMDSYKLEDANKFNLSYYDPVFAETIKLTDIKLLPTRAKVIIYPI